MDLADSPMNSMDKSMQALQNQVSELQRRVQELDLENADLRHICTANGIQYEESLRAQRHRRYVANLYSEHPTGEMVVASDVVSLLPIMHRVAEFSDSFLDFAMISRSVLAAAEELTTSFPWRFNAGHVATTFDCVLEEEIIDRKGPTWDT